MSKSIVSTRHPDYDRMSDRWFRCRACVEGQDAVHAAGEKFLPRLMDQSDTEYNKYKLRASFTNYTWRTVQSLAGMLFRKPPEIEVAASVEPLLDDVTLDGRSLHIFAQQIALEVLTTGRVGVLCDYPQGDTTGLTLADTARMNLRPLLALYRAENVINWKQERIDNEMKLTLLVLTEDAALPENEFSHESEIRYRVLDLFDGKYRQRVFRINDRQEDEQVGPDIYPFMNGKPMAEIPFVFIGVDDTTPIVDCPPIDDLSDLNLDHYRLSADLKHGLHFGGLPTAVISGYTPENAGDKLYIGSASAWVFPDPQASASYLEYTGAGLTPISNEMLADQERMAVLGARLLSSEKKQVETATVAQIHRSGETSILSSVAQTISIGLTEALQIFSEWAGVDQEANIELNREFTPLGLDPAGLTALVSAWQSGAISFEVLFAQLQQNEIVASDLTFEDMQGQIEATPIPKPEPPVIVQKTVDKTVE